MFGKPKRYAGDAGYSLTMRNVNELTGSYKTGWAFSYSLTMRNVNF